YGPLHWEHIGEALVKVIKAYSKGAPRQRRARAVGREQPPMATRCQKSIIERQIMPSRRRPTGPHWFMHADTASRLLRQQRLAVTEPNPRVRHIGRRSPILPS